MAKDCTYRFTDQDGKERVIEGQAAFKAYLVDGGLQHLLPSAKLAFSAKQTETPEFKRWFGDSKVVDDAGKPLVVYHGTKEPPTKFAASRTGSASTFLGDYEVERHGIFAAEDPALAEEYANQGERPTNQTIMPLYLAIENPLDTVDGDYTDAIWNKLEKAAEELGAEDGYRTARFIGDLWGRGELWKLFDADENNDPAWNVKLLKRAGYDGMRIYERSEGDVENTAAWVAFDPNQIKSATGNTGAFDINNPDIRFSAKQTETPEFKRWFGDSKMVDAEGKPLVVYHGSISKGVTVFDTTRVTTRNAKGDVAGTYFTNSPESAYNYTRDLGASLSLTGPKAGIKVQRGDVTQAYLKIENPLNTTAAIKKYRKQGLSFGDAKRKAVEALTPEHDGIIFDGDKLNPPEYVVFNPNQIKSATGNTGAFDINNPDIRYSRECSSTSGQKGRKESP